jgi:hypothetical protein
LAVDVLSTKPKIAASKHLGRIAEVNRRRANGDVYLMKSRQGILQTGKQLVRGRSQQIHLPIASNENLSHVSNPFL